MSELNVSQNAPQNPNAMGGAPTTTSNVDGQISPTQAPAVNPTPATPAPAAPQPAATPQPRPAMPTPQPTKQGLHSAIFDGVLKTLGGGTQYINRTDPATGATTQEPIQQSRGQLGKSILAGAIAGMFGGMGARDAEGRHDPGKAAAMGFEAGQKPMQEKVAQLQKTADEDTSRRQMTMKNNMDLMHQQIAMTHMKHTELDATAKSNNEGILADADTFDKNLSGADVNDPTKKAIQGRGMTYKEALDKLHGNWSNTLAIVDGSQEVRGPNGEMEVEPTYAVLNPNVTLKMSEQQAAALAKFKPAYQNAYQATGGNLKIPLNRYVSDVHQLNSLNNMEAFFENAKDQLGIKGAPDFAAIARKGGQPVLDAVKDAENAIGQGGDPVDALRRIAGTGGGALILKGMGITNEQVNDLVNERDKKAALAKEGGQGERAPATSAQIAAYESARNSLPEDQKDQFIKPPAGGWTQGQLEKEQARIDARFAENKKEGMQAGDPAVLESQSNLAIGAGDLTAAKDLFPGNRSLARANYNQVVAQKALSLGLNPTHFTVESMKEKAAKDEEYKSTKNNSVGASLNSFDTFLTHNAEAVEASNNWKRTNQRLWNMPFSELEKNFGTDPEFIKFKAALVAPGKEFMNFLNSNRAEHEADIKAADQILDPNMSPARITAALQQLARTADARAASLGDSYVGVVGTTYPRLLTENGLNTLKQLGVSSKAAAFTGQLPRNSAFAAQPSVQNLRPADLATAKLFAAAAGNDPKRTEEMMREHGWTLANMK